MLGRMSARPPSSTEPLPSFYWATRPIPPALPPVAGIIDADVAVVGGGFTGVSTALHLAERGIDVVLLEAERIGWGASGRNGGQIVPGYAADIRQIEASLGTDTAADLWRLGMAAVDLVATLVARHRIECNLTPGFLTAAVKPAHACDLIRLAEHLVRYYDATGLEPIGRTEISQRLGTTIYHGGLIDQRGGHLDPLALARGLAAAATAAGARLHEGSRVTKIERGPRPELRTASGCVRARHVVLAGNAYLGDLVAEIEGAIIPAATFMIATEPLGDAGARSLIGDDFAVCDTRHALNYYRLSADRRLLFGGGISYAGHEPAALRLMLRDRLLRVFPQLATTDIPFGWSGLVDISRNRLPQIGRLADGVFYAQGFSGHGVALTLLAGEVIAAAIGGDTGRFDRLAAIPHRNFPGGRHLRAPILAAGRLWYRLLDAL
jgi:gamma-glutamylputrescine oxidase